MNNNISVKSKDGLRNESGTALGLSICRDLLNIHGGNMIIKSTLGSGSEFIINISQTKNLNL